jgi:hypothetical protein
MVSFFTRRPVTMAAVITGESSPRMMVRINASNFIVKDFAVLNRALQRFLRGESAHDWVSFAMPIEATNAYTGLFSDSYCFENKHW